MIGIFISFVGVMFSIISVFVTARENRFYFFCALGSLVFNSFCFYISIYVVRYWHNRNLLLILIMFWNNFILFLSVGAVFGDFDLFISLCIGVCISSMASAACELYKEEEKEVDIHMTKIPRITYLEVW